MRPAPRSHTRRRRRAGRRRRTRPPPGEADLHVPRVVRTVEELKQLQERLDKKAAEEEEKNNEKEGEEEDSLGTEQHESFWVEEWGFPAEKASFLAKKNRTGAPHGP